MIHQGARSIRTNTPDADAGMTFSCRPGDVQIRQIDAEVRVALVGANDNRARFRDREIGTGHPRVGLQKVRPCMLPLALNQVVDIAVLGISADGLRRHGPRRCEACARRATMWLGGSSSSC